MNIWIIFIGFMILSWIVSMVLKSKFKKYSKILVDNGMSGRDVAERMLRDHGISDVRIESVQGHLTDHYNPVDKTINLSPEVYNGRSISAAAVAAHECGHAVQHATAYAWLGFRSKLVPVVSFSSKWVQWIFLAECCFFRPSLHCCLPELFCLPLQHYSVLLHLPVEIDASRRALAWLSNAGITSYQNHDKAQDALKWAAYTYVVAALGSLATLLYYIMIFTGSRR